jgi:aryl-alcohol dehydrogenase-like predicted oxidoreductase
MAFGRWIDEAASAEIIDTAIDQGINFIDTADLYGKGQDEAFKYGTGDSESIIGRALKGKRDKIVLATKVGGAMGRGRNESGYSRVHIMREVEQQLVRLQTDYIDYYQVHSFKPETPLEETLRALDDLVRQGKVRYIGCSNYAAWQIAKCHAISDRMNLEKFIAVQSEYNLLRRDIENEIIPFCKSENVGLMVYSPLARGVLAGRYRTLDDVPEDSRAAHGEEKIKSYFTERNFSYVDQYASLAQKHGISLAQLSLAWVLQKPEVTTAIIGASKVHHVTDALKTAEWQMPEDLTQEIEKIGKP